MWVAISIVGGVLVLLVILAATKPSTFEVRRSIEVAAAPERVFEQLHDFHRWGGWSPWEKIDPDLQRTYSGATSGVGAIYEWLGKKAGQGRMEILSASPKEGVSIQLDFIKPFASHYRTDFTLTPAGPATRVDWVMRGPQPFLQKLMSVFMSFDKMVGKDFDKGLASLKAVAEA